jgi:hypothetical protein
MANITVEDNITAKAISRRRHITAIGNKVSFFTLIYCDQATDDIYYKYTPSARFFKAKYTKNKRARSMKNR